MTTGVRVVLSVFILSLLAGIISGSVIYYRLCYLTLLILGISWLWSHFSLRGISVNRKARMLRAQIGQILEERFEVVNNSALPRFWIVVHNESPLPHAQGSRVIPWIEGHRAKTYVARTRLTQRGIFSLGPTTLESGDPFGLFLQKVEFPSNSSLMVYPWLVDVDWFPDPTGTLSGGESIRRRTAQITPNAASVRDYAPGDPLNRIHWASTAKRQRLMSKEFELDPRSDVWLFLDAMRSAHLAITTEMSKVVLDPLSREPYKYVLPPSTEEYSVSIVASLARYYLKQGRSVGLGFAGRVLTILSPEHGARQLNKILESLALFRANGEIPIYGLVEVQLRSLARGSVVVLVTPSVQREVAFITDRLKRCGMYPIVVLIDASSFNGPSGTDEIFALISSSSIPAFIIKRSESISLNLLKTTHSLGEFARS